MNEVKGTEESKTETIAEAKPNSLSLRDALEVAIIGTKDPETPKRGTRSKPILVSEDEISGKPAKEAAPAHEVSSEQPAKSLSAPGEWTPAERDDFNTLSQSQKEAALRLYNSRKGMLDQIRSEREQINKERAETKAYKELADSMTPYLKAVGINKPTELALKEALGAWHDFETKDPRQAAAEYLAAKKIPVPKELQNASSSSVDISSQIAPLQEKLATLENKLSLKDREAWGRQVKTSWDSFESEKNASGSPKYPDVDNSESGLKMAASIGSLVGGQTELSRQFIAHVSARIPGATYTDLIREAYRYYGGRVDDTASPTKSQETQELKKHIVQSKRAASITPGSGVVAASSGVKKFKTYREAAAHALAEIREREG